MNGTIWYLKQCDLFERLSDAEADQLNRRALLRRFAKRTLVYVPTEPGESVMVLASGRVKIKDLTLDGRETILAFIEEGELFGELALLDGLPRQEYAETVEDSQVLLIPREDLLALMKGRADLTLSITKLMGVRRQRVENRLRNVLFLSSRERMVRLLVELAEAHGQRVGTRTEIRFPLSHQELASLIGVSRETATITLGQLEQAGLVVVQRRKVSIVSMHRLQAEARGQADATAPAPPARGRAAES
jgi:CRP-like cAMP-binding protein